MMSHFMSHYRIPPQLSTAFVDLPSVEKSVPPKRPLGGQPPKLLPKPEIQQHKPPASTTKEEPPKEMSQSITEEKKSAGCFCLYYNNKILNVLMVI